MVLTTRDRPGFLQVALACYQHQTYPLRELIVIDDGDQFPADESSVEAVGGRLIRVPPGTPLGTKLNLGLGEARGWLCQKMDGRWSASEPLPKVMRPSLLTSFDGRLRRPSALYACTTK